MNSDMIFMWYQGGRKVFSATAQRSGKMTKSMFAVPAVSDGDVSTVKIDCAVLTDPIRRSARTCRRHRKPSAARSATLAFICGAERDRHSEFLHRGITSN